jgi:hypothetical protein
LATASLFFLRNPFQTRHATSLSSIVSMRFNFQMKPFVALYFVILACGDICCAIFSLRRYLLRDICFAILACGDICCAIATSCLRVFVFKKCFNRRRIQRLYPQLAPMWFVFFLCRTSQFAERQTMCPCFLMTGFLHVFNVLSFFDLLWL